jgi:molecular chaperone GrpE
VFESLTPKRSKRSGATKSKTKEKTASKPAHTVSAEKSSKIADMTKKELVEALEAAQKRVDDFKTQLAYLQAEYANSIKAFERREAQLVQQANRDLVLQLLPVLDDLERARVMVPLIEANEPFIEGLEMVIKSFKAALQAAGVKPIECQGQNFDPLRHEAISHEETTEHPPNMVIEELRRGYLLKGSLLRPSLVKIAKQPTEKEERSKGRGKDTAGQKSGENKDASTK